MRHLLLIGVFALIFVPIAVASPSRVSVTQPGPYHYGQTITITYQIGSSFTPEIIGVMCYQPNLATGNQAIFSWGEPLTLNQGVTDPFTLSSSRWDPAQPAQCQITLGAYNNHRQPRPVATAFFYVTAS